MASSTDAPEASAAFTASAVAADAEEDWDEMLPDST